MSDSSEHTDIWHWLTLWLWGVFFLVGLFPEYVFDWLRILGRVSPHRAMVNSYHVITLSLSAYLYFFSYRRCIEAEASPTEAHGKALQMGIFGLLAFLPVTQVVMVYRDIPVAGLQKLVLAVGTAKLAAWIYLYTVLIRYYCMGGAQVYRRMRSIFPSSVRADKSPPEAESGGEG